MAKVKICGITTLEDAIVAARAGAGMLGFHVELKRGRNPLTPEAVASIVTKLPANVSGVLVTSIVEPERLVELAKTTGVSALQLYGDMSPNGIRAVKAALPYIVIWKVMDAGAIGVAQRVQEYEGAADIIVLDSAGKGGALGGTGATHDWNISRKIVESTTLPIILAGGLTPENVAEAIRTVQPYGVDVNSGVSNADGSKNIEKVQAFVTAAK